MFNKFFSSSVIIMLFFEFILSLNKLLLINVSIVFPDLEIIIKRFFLKFISFFVFSIFNWSKLSKNINFF
jgi:hypothetical protein